MLDYQLLLLAPNYAVHGVSAVLTVGSHAPVTLAAIDKTSGVDLSSLGSMDLQTTVPAATVMRSDLDSAAITPAELEGATLTLNGKTWTVASWRNRPTPGGEAAGEVWLILEE